MSSFPTQSRPYHAKNRMIDCQSKDSVWNLEKCYETERMYWIVIESVVVVVVVEVVVVVASVYAVVVVILVELNDHC